MSEQLDSMKSSLMACAMSRMSDLENTDAKELGEVIDMIKDLEEAKYYCKITEAMENRTKSDETQDKIDTALMMERMRNQSDASQSYYGGRRGYYPHMGYPDKGYDDRMYYDDGRMYYDGRDRRRGGTERSYSEVSIPSAARDYREGRSYRGRKGYMESQENHMTDEVKMDKLQEYISELDSDITEMVKDASTAEKDTLRDRLMSIAQRIA